MKAIITRIESNSYIVRQEDGSHIKCVAKGLFKFKKMSPLVGDVVEIQRNVIEKIYPRKNEFVRPPIANIDQLIIVLATTNPKPDLMLLDKQIIMAEKNNVEPIVCINKVDLDVDITSIIETYQNIGYQVITTAAKNGLGIEKIAILLNNKVTAFAGNSGVGKSALTNHIFQEEVSPEGEISDKIEKGKHTTKFVELYEFAPNSFLADTPGFSSFEVSGINYKELEDYFVEFAQFIDDCEYRGCSHTKEINCGVKKAVNKRKIDKGRYDRYCELYEKLKGEKKW